MVDRVLHEIIQKPEGGWEVLRPLGVRIREFRTERLHQIAADETPVPLEPGPRIALHFIPHASIDADVEVDVKQFADGGHDLRPLASSGWNHRYNADGFLIDSPTSEGRASGYLQLFRNGIVEAVTIHVFSTHKGQVFLSGRSFEPELIGGLTRCLNLAGQIAFPPPYAAGVGLVGVRDVLMATDRAAHWFGQGFPIGRDILLLPPVLIENAQADAAAVLRPSFDLVWQANGWPGSPHYDADGTRRD